MVAKKTKRIARIHKKPLMPVGQSDFKNIIDQGFYYVDKTLLIREMLPHQKSTVALICRPRRFGKTLNMTMLRYFFENTQSSNAYLFKDKKIWRDTQAKKHQGKYPVIFLTFKEVKSAHWGAAYKDLCLLIREEFSRHAQYIYDGLRADERMRYDNILYNQADEAEYKQSLKFLTNVLRRKSGQQVIFLLDEYDTPIVYAYQAGYYHEMVQFLQSLLGAVLKDSESLASGVITGISRIAKEGIFSDLNNLDVMSVTDSLAADKFGFTQHEVNDLLADYNMTNNASNIKKWFDGYSIGNKKNLYNPWSVINCVQKKGTLLPYWGKTSSNLLIQKLVLAGKAELKTIMQELLQGKTVPQRIDAGIIYPNIEKNLDSIWSLLLYTGYLTFENQLIDEDGNTICHLKIPNKEIQVIFKGLVTNIIDVALGSSRKFNEMLKALTAGNVDYFAELLQDFVVKIVSQFDANARDAENGYHMFLLGALTALESTYIVKSNREAGFGRFDILLIPTEPQSAGIIIELKKAKKKENLSKLASPALQQIKQREYAQELQSFGVETALVYGIAFEGKKLAVKMENLTL